MSAGSHHGAWLYFQVGGGVLPEKQLTKIDINCIQPNIF